MSPVVGSEYMSCSRGVINLAEVYIRIRIVQCEYKNDIYKYNTVAGAIISRAL